MSLERVRQFVVPRVVSLDAELALNQAGQSGYELFVLWSGILDGDRFQVRTQHVPRQRSLKLHGNEVMVRVEGDALHELNRSLYESGEMLGIQIHAHPSDAYHSTTDDAFPIVTTLGGLSIVVPSFCREGVFAPGTAIYRLTANGWLEQDRSLVRIG